MHTGSLWLPYFLQVSKTRKSQISLLRTLKEISLLETLSTLRKFIYTKTPPNEVINSSFFYSLLNAARSIHHSKLERARMWYWYTVQSVIHCAVLGQGVTKVKTNHNKHMTTMTTPTILSAVHGQQKQYPCLLRLFIGYWNDWLVNFSNYEVNIRGFFHQQESQPIIKATPNIL